MNKLKKIVAIVTTFSFLFTAAAPASATTVEELQAQIAALLAQIAALQAQLSGVTGGTTISGCTISSFTRNLSVGMTGDDVKCLQIVLNSDASTQVAASGVGSSGNETNYFGSLTKAAVIKFQEKYASEVLATYGLTSGTGYVGTTTRAKLNSLLSAGTTGTGGTTETGTAAAVIVASDTPEASQTALAAQDVVFTKLKFTAGATGYTVSSMYIARSGIAADADVSAVKLYDGTTQVGSTQALNTTTHKASFTGMNFTVPAYGVKYLTVKGSIAAKGTATVGDSIKLGIATASDITSTLALSGTFPMYGNAMTIAGITVGELWVAKKTSPATTTNMLSGATDQEIACWDFSASNTEGFDVHSIKISQVGTASRQDLSNLKLKVAGVQIGSTVSQFDSTNGATFDLSSSPLSILAGTTKTVCAFTDIGAGIYTSRTVIFEITQYTDVVAYGSNSGGAVTVGYDDTTAFTKQTGNTMTIGQGTLSVAIDASLNPSVQTYVKGTTNRLISALKFSTASIEGARVTSIKLTLGGTGSATDISNVTLWDGTTQIAQASVVGSYVTFGPGVASHSFDSSGLFDIPVSSVKTIQVKADIPTGATSGNTVSLSVGSASDIWADGLSSQYDLPSGSITGTASGNAHQVSAEGNLAVSLSSQTPSAQTYVIGATEKEFTRINLTADSGEDIAVTAITLDLSSNRQDATSGAHFTNVKLLKEDGTQFGTTYASPVASASFSGTLTVPASQTVVLKAIADIPSTNYPSPYGAISVASTTAIGTALTSTGLASAADIDESGSAIGNTMSIGQGSLTVAAASSPSDQTVIIGASEVPLVGLVLTAGTQENIRITSFTLTQSSSGEGSTTDVTYLALYDGSTRLTAKESLTAVAANRNYVTFSGSDWINGIGLDLAKGQQKTITVKGDIPATAVNTHKFAIGVSTSDNVVFTGLSSNTTPSPTVSGTTGANYHYTKGSVAANCAESTLTTAGILTVNTSADTPIEGIQAVGTVGLSNVAFLKAYFTATMEEIYIKSITIESKGTPTSTNPATFASVSLWDGTTQLGSAQALNNDASTTFNFAPGSYWKIPTVGAKYLTIKANLNGVRTLYSSGAVSGDNIYLCIDNVTAEGVSSGSTPASGSGTIDECDGNYRQTIRQSKPTITLASPTSETYNGGTQELYRWSVTADSLGDISWRKVIFDMTGGVILTSGGSSYTVGSAPAAVKTDGVYMSTTTTWGGAAAGDVKQLIATSSMQIWDVDANTQVTATSGSGTSWTVDQATATGTARISFVASADQVIAAGTTKTYKFIGEILQGSGQPGSSISTKIAGRSTATTTGTYATVAATTANFVWSDRSGGSYAAHSAKTSDWINEYKLTGIPTSTKTLSK